ncbi:MAG: Flp family type IVb pilin [Acidimicrobiia bacterium]
MLSWMNYLQARINDDERGAAAVEYALLVTLIAVAIIVAAGLLGTNISKMFDTVAGKITG